MKIIFALFGDDESGTILPQFKEKFTVRRQDAIFLNLIIRNTSLTDAGSYTCIDDDGQSHGPGLAFGQWASANLNVIGTVYIYLYNLIMFLLNSSVGLSVLFLPLHLSTSYFILIHPYSASFLKIMNRMGGEVGSGIDFIIRNKTKTC